MQTQSSFLRSPPFSLTYFYSKQNQDFRDLFRLILSKNSKPPGRKTRGRKCPPLWFAKEGSIWSEARTCGTRAAERSSVDWSWCRFKNVGRERRHREDSVGFSAPLSDGAPAYSSFFGFVAPVSALLPLLRAQSARLKAMFMQEDFSSFPNRTGADLQVFQRLQGVE